MSDPDDQKKIGRPRDWRLAARLLHYLYPYKWAVLASAALTALNVPLATAGPLFTKAAIDLFLAPAPARPLSGYVLKLRHWADFLGLGGSGQRGLVFIAILFLLVNIAQSAVQYCQTVVTEWAGQNAIHDLRVKIFSHLQKVPIPFYDKTPVGRLMTHLTTDVDSLNEMFNSGMITILGNAVMALYIVGWMFRINRPLALVSVATLAGIVIFTVWFRASARPVFRRLSEQIAVINAFLQEHLTGMQVVQIFTREAREMEEFRRINHEHWRAAKAVTLRNAVFYPGIETMALAGVALIIWFGGGQAVRNLISIGSLVAFIQLAQSLYDSVTEIGSRYHLLQSAMASGERIFRLLDEPILAPPSGRSPGVAVSRGRIEFRNVWFAYHGEEWVLKDISFVVEPGEKVAFVGRTGSGKTTLISLLLRYYEIQRGRILIDDVDIRQMDTERLRSQFGIVPQDVFLFCGDIASNVRLGNQSISGETVRGAARAVQIDQFIANLPKGYESEVLEQGVSLSAGQRQLIGFARAIAFDRPILILDEATSSIDTQTEIRIRAAVRRIMTGRTALVIAHRLSTIQAVDKIVVMHQGEIREAGDHRSLLLNRGLYWRLHRLQFRHSAAAAAELTADD